MTEITVRRGFIQIPIIAAIAALIVAASATIFGQVAQQGRQLETVGATINLTATPSCRNAAPVINLSWTAVGEENNYQISRQGGQGSWGAGSLLRTFTDFDVTGGTTYTYQVTSPSTGLTSNQTQATALTAEACGQLSQPQPTPQPSPQASPTPAPSPTPPAQGGTNRPPSAVTIAGPTQGAVGQTLTYSLQATDPDGDRITYRACWDANGDGTTDQTAECRHNGPVASGSVVSVNASWPTAGSFLLLALATDGKDYSGWSWQTVTISSATGGITPTPIPTPRPSIQPQPTPLPQPTPTPPVGATQKPGAFSLTSPADGATGVSANPSFKWTGAAGAQNYWVYVSQSSTGWQWFKQTSQSQAAWNGGSGWQKMEGVSQEPPAALNNGYGSWFVTAENSAGQTHSPSAFAFTVSATSQGFQLTPPPVSTIPPGGPSELPCKAKSFLGHTPPRLPSGTPTTSSIWGTVRNTATNAPFDPATVTIHLWWDTGDSSNGPWNRWVYVDASGTNNDGLFYFNCLPAGAYRVEVNVQTATLPDGSYYRGGSGGKVTNPSFNIKEGESVKLDLPVTLFFVPPPSGVPNPPPPQVPSNLAPGQPDLSRAPENTTPSIPDTPQGPTTGVVGQTYTYTAWTSSPQDNAISIRFVIIPEKGRTVLHPSGTYNRYIPEGDAIFINTAGTNRPCAQGCDRSIDYAFPSPDRYYIAAIGVDEGHAPLYLGPGTFSMAWSPYLTVDISPSASTSTEAQPMQGGGQGAGGGLLQLLQDIDIAKLFRNLFNRP